MTRHSKTVDLETNMKKFLAVFVLILWNTQAFAQVIISEVAWMGTMASHYDEWIEIFNSGSEIIDLSGWTLSAEYGSPNITLSGIINPDEFLLFERTDDEVTSLPAHQIYSGGLSNDGEVLFLKNKVGEIIDQTPNKLPWVAGNNEERRTMERSFPIKSGLEESSWHTFSLDTSDILDTNESAILGSPGSKSSPPPILPNFTGTVEIISLSPILKNIETPWLKFSILNPGLFDIDGWTISNENESQFFMDHLEHLTLISGGTSTAPGHYLPDNPETPIVFEWNTELLPILNSGVFSIKNEEAATLSQKQINTPQILISEISINHQENDFIELFVKECSETFDAKFLEIKHNGTRLFFAENSLKIKESDFLTFDLISEKIQEEPVRYRNTTIIRETGDSYSWESSSKNGLNGSSGTLELILFADTNWEANTANEEQTEDFICWEKESLSETEQNRLDKNIPQNWQNECINISEIIPNESMARREPIDDRNLKSDFFRHFNGSPGKENISNNKPPIAKFYIQGSPNVTTSANLSAIDEENYSNGSYDPDGQHDLKNFLWEINGKSCGDFTIDGWEWKKSRNGESLCDTINPEKMEWIRENPDRIYFNFEKKSAFKITLTVEDYSGKVDEFSETITQTIISRSGSNGAFENSIKSWLKKEFVKGDLKKRTYKIKNEYLLDGFFDEFILTISPKTLVSISFQKKELPLFDIPKTRTALFQREKYTKAQLKRIQKNIGLIFLDPHATAWGKLRDQMDPTEIEQPEYSPLSPDDLPSTFHKYP